MPLNTLYKFDAYCLREKDMPKGTTIGLMAKTVQVVCGDPCEEEDDDLYDYSGVNDVLEQNTEDLWLPNKILLIGFHLPDETVQYHFVDFKNFKGDNE